MKENMELYDRLRSVPENAKKSIGAGRLKGMTDINPMWRIQKLTEEFGRCGKGWKYIIREKRLEAGADGTICAFVDIDLYYKDEGEWSEAIPGTGGSSFVAIERNGPYTSDECFKMALTDAISVAAKALGLGADVYFAGGRTKYSAQSEAPAKPKATAPITEPAPEESPRRKLVRLIKEHGIDASAYSAEHGLNKDTPDEVILKCIKDLEAI